MDSQTGIDNLIYDLVSIQYHAMKGAQVYSRYVEDARGHPDAEAFIREVRMEDENRAKRCHELLSKYAKQGISGLAA